MARRQPVSSDYADDEDEFEAEAIDGAPLGSTRMVDWFRAFGTPMIIAICGFLAALALAQIFPGAWYALAAISLTPFLVLLSIFVEFSGYKFSDGKLSYPMYLVRRTIDLADLRDATGETTTKRRKSDYGRIIGETKSVTTVTKTYAVHLSGAFGVRTMTFSSVKKREQFFSLLHVYAPQARIRRRHY
jgi:hypothetical protein